METGMEATRFDAATRAVARTRRRVVAGAATLALGGVVRGLVSPPVARAAKRKRAYRCAGPPEVVIFLDGDTRQGQRFSAARSGSLRQIKGTVHKVPGSTGGDYVVQLVKVTGSPNGTPS